MVTRIRETNNINVFKLTTVIYQQNPDNRQVDMQILTDPEINFVILMAAMITTTPFYLEINALLKRYIYLSLKNSSNNYDIKPIIP